MGGIYGADQQEPSLYRMAMLTGEEVLAQAGTSPKDGLSSSAAVQDRLAARGQNGIAAGRVTREEIAIRQSRSAFTYLLLIAAAIVFVIPGGAFPQV